MTPLEAFYDLLSPIGLKEEGLKRYYLIETALKDYEQRLALAKEYKDVDKVAKRLKALEIIKREGEVVCEIIWRTCKNKEEYELIREVLLNEINFN